MASSNPNDGPAGSSGAMGHGQSGGGPAGAPYSNTPYGGGNDLEKSSVGRLLIVPMVIVAAIVGSAVIVVVLFGRISAQSDRSVNDLLALVEQSIGARNAAGMLMTREKEMWQAAQELVVRLENKEAELTPEEIQEISQRLARDIESTVGWVETQRNQSVGQDSDSYKVVADKLRLEMYALAETDDPRAAELLSKLVTTSEVAEVRQLALMAMGRMVDLPNARAMLPAVTRAIGDEDTVVRSVACTLAGSLATGEDSPALEALRRAVIDDDREVQWNAGLSLGRLGDEAGVGVLLDMLSRDYWQDEVKARIPRAGAAGVDEYPLPQAAIERYLVAAIDAAENLSNDADIRKSIEALTTDSAPAVAGEARLALQESAEPKPQAAVVGGESES